MNCNFANYHLLATLLLIQNLLVEMVSSYPNESFKNATESEKIDSEPTLGLKRVNVTANPLENYNKTSDANILPPSDRGFLNWIYPNPSVLKQSFYRCFFDGIIALGVYMQYDTVKRQIIVTLKKILTQWKKEKAEREEKRKDAELYYNSYTYPYGYQYPAKNKNLDGYEEEKPEHQAQKDEIKDEKPNYQQSTDSEKSGYTSYGNELIEKRRQYFGDENSIESNISSSRVRERLTSLTNEDCFQKGLCQLEKLRSISPTMARLWLDIRNYFSSGVSNDHLPNQNRNLNCETKYRSCHKSTLELIKYLMQ